MYGTSESAVGAHFVSVAVTLYLVELFSGRMGAAQDRLVGLCHAIQGQSKLEDGLADDVRLLMVVSCELCSTTLSFLFEEAESVALHLAYVQRYRASLQKAKHRLRSASLPTRWILEPTLSFHWPWLACDKRDRKRCLVVLNACSSRHAPPYRCVDHNRHRLAHAIHRGASEICLPVRSLQK